MHGLICLFNCFHASRGFCPTVDEKVKTEMWIQIRPNKTWHLFRDLKCLTLRIYFSIHFEGKKNIFIFSKAFQATIYQQKITRSAFFIIVLLYYNICELAIGIGISNRNWNLSQQQSLTSSQKAADKIIIHNLVMTTVF